MRGTAQDVAEYLHELFPDDEVVAFHYRGYAPSTGSPSAEALIADAPLVYDVAVEAGEAEADHRRRLQHRQRHRRPACAQARKLDGLILVTPFDSLKAVAQSMYPWLPIGPVLRARDRCRVALEKPGAGGDHRRRTRRDRSRASAPTRFARAVPNLVFDRTIAGAGHNDIYARSDFHEAMREALDRSQSVTGRPLLDGTSPIHILEIKGAICGRATLTDPQS